MKSTKFLSNGRQLFKPNMIFPQRMSLINPVSVKGFKQTNNLVRVMDTAQLEEKQRYAKFVEYTDKIYKPSKTITYNREGEILLFSCDNIKHSRIYFPYPYCLYDMLFPIGMYNFFIDPCKYNIYNNIYCTLHIIFFYFVLFNFSFLFS